MKIVIHCIGKLKESYWKEAVAEYAKRLSSYCQVVFAEHPDLPTPENASFKVEQEIKTKECEPILKALKPTDFLAILDLNGKEMTSLEFSLTLIESLKKGGSTLHFAIGGSLGLSEAIKERANLSISFGRLTYPHQQMRVMLLEQIYRGFKISRGEPYHK